MFRVPPGHPARIDRVLARRYPGASRRQIAALFARHAVRVDGRAVKKGSPAPAGAEVAVAAPAPTAAARAPVPEPDAPLAVLHCDRAIVVVAKPAGQPCHPLEPGERGTLAGALVARFPECAAASADIREAGLVHRLDTGTSGVLVAARRADAWRALRDAFTAGAVDKRYLALTVDAPGLRAGACRSPLVRRGPRVVVVEPPGERVVEPPGERVDDRPDWRPGDRLDASGPPGRLLDARTEWRVLQRSPASEPPLALIECRARTGRMHQVRAHLAHVGAPLAGDIRYGGPALRGLDSHFLHASRIDLPHPDTGARASYRAALPDDRRAVLLALGFDATALE